VLLVVLIALKQVTTQIALFDRRFDRQDRTAISPTSAPPDDIPVNHTGNTLQGDLLLSPATQGVWERAARALYDPKDSQGLNSRNHLLTSSRDHGDRASLFSTTA
jgi:hypothetical protein